VATPSQGGPEAPPPAAPPEAAEVLPALAAAEVPSTNGSAHAAHSNGTAPGALAFSEDELADMGVRLVDRAGTFSNAEPISRRKTAPHPIVSPIDLLVDAAFARWNGAHRAPAGFVEPELAEEELEPAEDEAVEGAAESGDEAIEAVEPVTPPPLPVGETRGGTAALGSAAPAIAPPKPPVATSAPPPPPSAATAKAQPAPPPPPASDAVYSSSPPPDESVLRFPTERVLAEVVVGNTTPPRRAHGRAEDAEVLDGVEFEEEPTATAGSSTEKARGKASAASAATAPSTSAPPPAPARAAANGGASAPPPVPVAAAAAVEKAPAPRRKRRPKQWFEEIFDDDYLRTLPLLTAEQTEREAVFIAAALRSAPGAALLDLGCGYGRHALELAARGYAVTAVDLSVPLLVRAADAARCAGVDIKFVQGDMRELSFTEEFDAAYCYFSTFGYFDDETNRKVAANVARALKPGGRFLLDLINRDHLVGELPTRVWWEGDGCMVLEEVDFNYFTSRIQSHRSIVFEDGRQLEQDISIRAYSLHEIGLLLHQAGFRVTEVSGSPSVRGRFFGAESRQLLVVAEKK